jgi:2-polyprenyl-6-methoxyphenol hydroxylase-like FAD-dependent oxidoreductase
VTVEEPARRTPLLGESQVLVLGGGPAGIAAAVASARRGARTALIERQGFLGGMGTAGGVTNFAGLYGRRLGTMQRLVRGVVDELLDRIDRLGGLNEPQDGMQGRIRVRSYDVPAYKCAADEMLRSAGVEVLFHALCCGVVMRHGRHIDAVLLETRAGRQAWRAQAYVDASGDGDLAAQAGVPWDYGDGQGNALYPSTMALIGGVDAARARAAVGEFGAIDRLMEAAATRHTFARRGAILRPQRDPTRWRANVTQLRNAQGQAANALDPRELTQAEFDGRRQVVDYLRFLREEVPGFERAELLDLPAQVGVRETRRIRGAYRLTGDDVLQGARFDDVIGLNAWPVEQHVNGAVAWSFPHDPQNAYNHLPMRMLRPQGVDNLLVAGRCASMEHLGQSAARASGACFVMGQAAGTAAALRCVEGWSLDAGNAASRLQQALREDGVDLDDRPPPGA